MNQTIKNFLDNKEIAIVGASPKKSNFGLTLMKELSKEGFNVYPVNPNHTEVDGKACYPAVSDLPNQVENVLIVVNPERANMIIAACEKSQVKRVWLHQGAGKGAYSKESLEQLKAGNLEFVYGFCPMMFIGKGIHKFHFWLRKNLGSTPAEFDKTAFPA